MNLCSACELGDVFLCYNIIARTDANSVEGLDKTLDRIKAYEDAGADMIFPEAMKDEKEFEAVRKISKKY